MTLRRSRPSSFEPCSQISRMISEGRRSASGGERGIAVVRQTGLVALILQDTGNEFADVGLIIDDENISCHIVLPALKPSFGGLFLRRSGMKLKVTRAP